MAVKAKSADATAIRPFTIETPEADLDDLRARVAATRWPEKETVDDASQGVELATMRARRSSRSASGVSIVNGRIAVASAVSALIAMWIPPLGSRSSRLSGSQKTAGALSLRSRDRTCEAAPCESATVGDCQRGRPL